LIGLPFNRSVKRVPSFERMKKKSIVEDFSKFL